MADPDAGGLQTMEPAGESPNRSAHEDPGPVHGERRFAGVYSDAGGRAISGIVADPARCRAAECGCAAGTHSLVGAGWSGADGGRIWDAICQRAAAERAGGTAAHARRAG